MSNLVSPTRPGPQSHDTEEFEDKFEEKLTCGSENDMRNLANFHQSTQK